MNAYTTTEESPLGAGDDAIMTVDPLVESAQISALNDWRKKRDDTAVLEALESLKRAAADGSNIMEPSIHAAKMA